MGVSDSLSSDTDMRLLLLTLVGISWAAQAPPRPHPAIPLRDQTEIGRIVGGTEAEDGEFPFQVSLRSVGALGATHFCGGSIIDKDWIMTAGHCCAGQLPLTMHVVAGGIKLNNFENEEEPRNVDNIIGHPSYSSSNMENDVCLLKLKESLEWTEFGQVTEAGTDCVITGWGTLAEGGFGLPNVLHK